MRATPLRIIAVLITGLETAVSAELIHANGNVKLVHGTLDITSGSPPVSGASDGNTTLSPYGQIFTTSHGELTTDYFVAEPEGLVFDIDLGKVYSLASVSFWNRGAINGNGVTAFKVVFSTDSIFGNGDDSSAFTFKPTNSGGSQQTFNLSSPVKNAQFARVSITDNDSGVLEGGDRVGLTEIQFGKLIETPTLVQVGGIALSLEKAE